MIHVWRVQDKSNDDSEQPCEKNPLKLIDSVTAVTFAPRLINTDKFVEDFLNQIMFSFINLLDILWLRVLIMVLCFSTRGTNKHLGNIYHQSILRKKTKEICNNFIF